MIHLLLEATDQVFEVALYQVLIHGQCNNYSRWQSASPQFGESAGVKAEGSSQAAAKHMYLL